MLQRIVNNKPIINHGNINKKKDKLIQTNNTEKAVRKQQTNHNMETNKKHTIMIKQKMCIRDRGTTIHCIISLFD